MFLLHCILITSIDPRFSKSNIHWIRPSSWNKQSITRTCADPLTIMSQNQLSAAAFSPSTGKMRRCYRHHRKHLPALLLIRLLRTCPHYYRRIFSRWLWKRRDWRKNLQKKRKFYRERSNFLLQGMCWVHHRHLNRLKTTNQFRYNCMS